MDKNGSKLGRCIYACNNNDTCEDQCVDLFKFRQFDCPCEVQCLITLYDINYILIIFQKNCPDGCPCDNYSCVETTSAPDMITPKANAVLVLSTWSKSTKSAVIFRSRRSSSLSIEADPWNQPNKPIVIGWDGQFFLGNNKRKFLRLSKPFYSGNYNDDLNFKYGEGTSVSEGCGATLMGQFWYFGGTGDYYRQVNSKVISNQKKIYSILGQQNCRMRAGSSK